MKQSQLCCFIRLETVSYTHLYCDRVIVMKDGKIYKELIRTGDRRTFLDELLTELKIINGGDGDEDE